MHTSACAGLAMIAAAALRRIQERHAPTAHLHEVHAARNRSPPARRLRQRSGRAGRGQRAVEQRRGQALVAHCQRAVAGPLRPVR